MRLFRLRTHNRSTLNRTGQSTDTWVSQTTVRSKPHYSGPYTESKPQLSITISTSSPYCLIQTRLTDAVRKANKPRQPCPPHLPPADSGGSQAIHIPAQRYKPSSRFWDDL